MLCSQKAQKYAHQLPGTASVFKKLLVIEIPGSWRKPVWDNALIPPDLQAYFDTIHTDGWRLLGVKQANHNGPFRVQVYTLEDDLFVGYETMVENYNDFMTWHRNYDVANMERITNQQVYICCHGVHDRCCGQFGVGFYQSMNEYKQEHGSSAEIWQCSHVGGHRMAPTALVMPQGYMYGHLTNDEIGSWLEYIESNAVYTPKARGSVLRPADEQFVELAVREQKGFTNIHDQITIDRAENRYTVRVNKMDSYGIQLDARTVTQDRGCNTENNASATEYFIESFT